MNKIIELNLTEITLVAGGKSKKLRKPQQPVMPGLLEDIFENVRRTIGIKSLLLFGIVVAGIAIRARLPIINADGEDTGTVVGYKKAISQIGSVFLASIMLGGAFFGLDIFLTGDK